MNGSTQKTIIFCIPGSFFSQEFLRSWTAVTLWCQENSITPILSQSNNPDLYTARNECLGGGIQGSTDLKPFQNQSYDYLMWIDSDQIFTPDHFAKLLGHDVDVVAGLYMMEDSGTFTTVKDWNEEYYKEHGRLLHLSPEEIQGQTKLLEVAFTGLGFCLFKHGVIESLDYPWFAPMDKKIGKINVSIGEDAAFFYRLREKGFKIYIDPTVIIGHERRYRQGPHYFPPIPEASKCIPE